MSNRLWKVNQKAQKTEVMNAWIKLFIFTLQNITWSTLKDTHLGSALLIKNPNNYYFQFVTQKHKVCFFLLNVCVFQTINGWFSKLSQGVHKLGVSVCVSATPTHRKGTLRRGYVPAFMPSQAPWLRTIFVHALPYPSSVSLCLYFFLLATFSFVCFCLGFSGFVQILKLSPLSIFFMPSRSPSLCLLV